MCEERESAPTFTVASADDSREGVCCPFGGMDEEAPRLLIGGVPFDCAFVQRWAPSNEVSPALPPADAFENEDGSTSMAFGSAMMGTVAPTTEEEGTSRTRRVGRVLLLGDK